jgi:hypothetical protein
MDKGRNDKCRFGWTGVSARKRVLGGGKEVQRLRRGHLAGSIDSEESRRVIICSLYSYREKQRVKIMVKRVMTEYDFLCGLGITRLSAGQLLGFFGCFASRLVNLSLPHSLLNT